MVKYGVVLVGVLILACTNAKLNTNSFFGSSNGNPYGNGVDGSLMVSTAMTPTATYSDTKGQTRTLTASRRITGVDATGTTLTLGSTFGSTEYQTGDEVMWIILAAGSTSACWGYHGKYAFAHVASTNGGASQLSLDNPMPSYATADNGVYNTSNFCMIELVRVPNFSSVSVTAGGSITVTNFSPSTPTLDGIFAFRVQGTLSIDGQILATGAGFSGTGYGYSGDSVSGQGASSALNNASGGGGGSMSSGAAGGGNYGAGGSSMSANGGAKYVDCSGSQCMPDSRLYFGGAGGGVTSLFGSSGGGIIYFGAHMLIGAGSVNVSGNPSSSGTTSSGSGAGGSALVIVNDASSFTGTIIANGGNGTGMSGAAGGSGGGGALESIHCKYGPPTLTALGGSGGFSAGGSGLTNDFQMNNACY